MESTEMKSPKFACLVGKGKFFFDDSLVESSFVLYRNPYRIGIIAEEGFTYETANKLVLEHVPVQLSGILNDGRSVKADVLYLTHPDPPENLTGVDFMAFEGVSLGQMEDTPPVKSSYPMTGFFKGTIALIHDGWEIKTIPCSDPNTAKALVQKWCIPVEGMVLELKREGSSMAQHEDFARIVMNLLSLALGTGVSCDRHFFTWAKEEIEIWSLWTGDEIGPGAIVPEFQLVKFLEQTLPKWQSLSQDQQKALRLARDYINLSERGYMDTRLLQIFQPWEFLVKAWKVQGKLSESESCLCSRLRRTCKQWNQDHSKCDPDGFWSGRISLIFKWPKLKSAIRQLATSFGLDLERIGLDLKMLNDARDRVTHSGKLADHPAAGPDKRASDLLGKGQYCLQLLILRILEYQGLVNHSKGGITTIVDINHALTTGRT